MMTLKTMFILVLLNFIAQSAYGQLSEALDSTADDINDHLKKAGRKIAHGVRDAAEEVQEVLNDDGEGFQKWFSEQSVGVFVGMGLGVLLLLVGCCYCCCRCCCDGCCWCCKRKQRGGAVVVQTNTSIAPSQSNLPYSRVIDLDVIA